MILFHEYPLFKNLLKRFLHFNIYFSYCQKTSLLMPISFMKSHEIIMASTQNARARQTLGALIGAVVGVFFGFIGVLIGPFIGAFLGEFMLKNHIQSATRAGICSWLGVILGTAALDSKS
jgi:uncharacterized protein YqgC (DUF456 family)